MNIMDNIILKLFSTPMIAILMMVSCEKMGPDSYHEDGSEITAAEAVDIVRPIIHEYAEEGYFWRISKEPIPSRTTLKYGPFGSYDPSSKNCGTFKSPGFKAWLILFWNPLIDSLSDTGICLFVNTQTGKYEEAPISGQVSGIEWDMSFCLTEEGPAPSNETRSPKTMQNRLNSSSSSSSGLYAVIISGGYDKWNNYSRYWNNCQYIYQRLTQTLGYDESHIYCLVADGTNPAEDMFYAYDYVNDKPLFMSSPLDFDNDGDNDIQYSATKDNISTVFNLLQAQSSSIEHLLVFVTDHGIEDGEICLWGHNQTLSPSELDSELDKLPGVKMDVVLGQCFSGAFVSPLACYNRTIATACSAAEQAHSQGEFTYGYFLHSWTDAFNPSNASTVDTNSDNMISLREAFLYAKSHDQAASYGWEHPQYASYPLIYGYTHDLQGADNCPVLSGSDYLSCNSSFTYTISGLPSSTSVTWDSLGELNLTSPTNTSVTAQGYLSSSDYVSSYPAAITAYFTLEGTQYFISKEIRAIWKPGVYLGGNHIRKGPGYYSVETGGGAYDYQWGSDNSAWVIMSPYGSSQVVVSEGQTSGPVTLWVTFKDPFGNTIVTNQQFNPTH